MQILCGGCGKNFGVLDDEEGTFACPHCGHVVILYAQKDAEGNRLLVEGWQDGAEGFAEQAKNVPERKIHVTCGSCGKHLVLGARLAGRQGRCPACGKAIQFPYPDDEGA